MSDSLNALTRRLNKIIDSKIREADQEGSRTDVETIYQKVKKAASLFLNKVLLLFGHRHLRILIGHRLKHAKSPLPKKFGRGGKRDDTGPQPEQTAFPGMEEFEGYPERLTYEDKPGHVIFVQSKKSHEFDREQAEKYAERLAEQDRQRNHYLKTGNRFARKLVRIYGDHPLEELVAMWIRDHQPGEEDANA